MRSKLTQYPAINHLMKLLLVFFFFLFLLFLVLRSTSSSTTHQILVSNSSDPQDHQVEAQESKNPNCSPTDTTTCAKIPPSLAQALVHYVTTNITPQQTFNEISVTMRVLLQKKSPSNLLVFGLGHDSLMWAALNHGGHTVFLEEDKSWIDQIEASKVLLPTLMDYSIFHVVYDTQVNQADQLLKICMGDDECKVVGDPRVSKCGLAHKGLPKEVYETEWDLIMVDAPTGYHDAAPGRMSAIYTAGLMARNREDGETHVFVHDVDRVVEDKFSRAFLCDGYLTEQEGRLRHFTIPSHRTRLGRPFCPRLH
ncbi:glucuronoxylan 4-O-methyltransferase 1-like [Cornus florida]|uniref:glucuronoxylan 4-O-methyltransferase 1-like n=1 Tax=Cornus florida TaxID=4283 RepID=UPI00289E388E|nr:glucuronoxylan 4-O-methyltransferase 1-like [Cornus florida]